MITCINTYNIELYIKIKYHKYLYMLVKINNIKLNWLY